MSRYIDADALKRAIKTECNPYGKPTIDFESGKKVLKIIDNAPTVEQSPVIGEVISFVERDSRPKGKWIKQDNGYIMCPFCKTDTKHGAWWEYCPKCGARMER